MKEMTMSKNGKKSSLPSLKETLAKMSVDERKSVKIKKLVGSRANWIDNDDLRVATHEAGHVAVALKLGIPIKRAAINQDPPGLTERERALSETYEGVIVRLTEDRHQHVTE